MMEGMKGDTGGVVGLYSDTRTTRSYRLAAEGI